MIWVARRLFSTDLLYIALSDSYHSVVSPETSIPETAYRFISPVQLNDSSDSNSWCRATGQCLSITDTSNRSETLDLRFPCVFLHQDIQLFRQSPYSSYAPPSTRLIRVTLIRRHPLRSSPFWEQGIATCSSGNPQENDPVTRWYQRHFEDTVGSLLESKSHEKVYSSIFCMVGKSINNRPIELVIHVYSHVWDVVTRTRWSTEYDFCFLFLIPIKIENEVCSILTSPFDEYHLKWSILWQISRKEKKALVLNKSFCSWNEIWINW